jgi:hypothetical protein
MMMAKETTSPTDESQRVQVRLDESDLTTNYSNAFQTNMSPDELFLTFGLNQMAPPQEDQAPQVLLHMESRILMNWKTAKRLAIQVSQAVRNHEQQFGEIDLDTNPRTPHSETV